jgi:hypothetical protein
MAALVTQADLTARFGATRVREVFCDDGGGTVGPRLTTSLAVGSRDAEAELLKAWPSDQIQTLIDGDEAIKAAVCDLVLADGMSGRPQWQGDGSPAETLRKTALDKLKAYAAAEKRSAAEADAGTNPNARVGVVTSGRRTSDFVFAPSAGRPYPRGF